MNHRDVYYVFDKPVPFKDLLIYPIRMEDYLEFMAFSECLTIDKNSIPDAKIISMSYLGYLMEYTTMDNLWIAKLDRILRLSLNDKDRSLDIKYGYNDNNKPILMIGDLSMDGGVFDELIDIICEQNMIEKEDYSISKEVRDALKSARDFRNRGGAKMAGLEDQIAALVSSTSLTVDDVCKLTIRKFTKIIERLDAKLHYQIYLAASMSGMVTFKDTSFIKHWLSDLSEKDKFGGNAIAKESIENKLSGKK